MLSKYFYIMVLISFLFHLTFCTDPKSSNDDSVTDIDGNVYNIVEIGNQWWMAENLKVTHYRNGEAISNVVDSVSWTNLSTEAWCSYDNDIGNKATYGLLYNWYAVGDSRQIAPKGWHVPTDEEWKELEMFLGMSQSAADSSGYRGTDEGSKLKSVSGWESDGNETNESGFTALPSGYRSGNTGGFYGISCCIAYFWTSTESSSSAWHRFLYYNSDVRRLNYSKGHGYSVRLVKD